MEATARFKRCQRGEVPQQKPGRRPHGPSELALGLLGERRRRNGRRTGSYGGGGVAVSCRAEASSGSGGKTAIVVGAGVNGLCTSVRLLESGYRVKCIAENVLSDPNE